MSDPPPSSPRFVSVKVEPAVLMREMQGIRPVLRGCGIPARDLEDMEQTVLVTAWAAVKDGRFKLLVGAELGPALGRWLYGIAWRQASHYTGAAYNRREIPSGLAMECTSEEEGPSSEGHLEAREVLRFMVPLLAAELRAVMALVAVGMTRGEIAEALGLPAGTVASYIIRARRLLREVLGGDGEEGGEGEEGSEGEEGES